MPSNALKPEQLARCTRADEITIELPCSRPDELPEGTEPSSVLVGHGRAARAIDYALNIDRPGYNLFVMGPQGIGKTRFLREALTRRQRQITSVDQLYLNRFSDPDKPLAVTVKAGDGARLRAAMAHLLQDLHTTVQAAFEAESYQQQIERLKSRMAQFERSRLETIQSQARDEGLALVQSHEGLVVAPMAGEEPMSFEQMSKLPDAEQNRLRERLAAFNEMLQKANRDSLKFRREQAAVVRDLNRQTAAAAVEPCVDDLRSQFAQYPALLEWFDSLHNDLLERYPAFVAGGEDAEGGSAEPMMQEQHRYQVNVLTEGPPADEAPAPIVQLDHPTVSELLGRIENRVRATGVHTDFTMIKPGALHKANGGYLLIDAWRLFSEPYAWDALKRALQRRAIRLESIAQSAVGVNGNRLDPDPIPLNVKVVLFGERESYYTLSELDPEFDALFRVTADFDDYLVRTPDHQNGLAQVLAEQACISGLLPLDRSALACLVDEASRRAEDQERLSAHVQVLLEIAVEADYEARQQGSTEITQGEILRAIHNRRDRSSRAHIEHQQAILKEVMLIATDDEVIGQVNGLAVYDIGGESFGHPSRITASTRLGDGQLLDIQRETHMGGAIHTKGVMTLSAYFGARYAPRHPMPVNASLVFEQSYGPIDGDSATVGELCALVSSIALLPLRQDLAVTGSMNQFGQVQAVGGLNYKIEGFFEICQSRGLTGTQGVIIPASNVSNLMLANEIVDAVRAGQFHIYAIDTVDEAIELLLGMPAGQPGDGPASKTVSAQVAQRLGDLLAQRNGGRAAARRARYSGGDRD